MIFDRIFEKAESKVFEPVRWFYTFSVVNVLLLLIRSDSYLQWKIIIKTIVSFRSTQISDGLINCFILQEMPFISKFFHIARLTEEIRGFWMIMYIVGALTICLVPENNYKNVKKLNIGSMLLAAIAFVWGVICLSGESVFVYFNF